MARRVGIVALLQESNTFVSRRTTLADFERDTLLEGHAIRDRFHGGHHEVTGFFEGLHAAGLEAAPIFAARALPSGTMTADTCGLLTERMLNALRRTGAVDGMLVAAHGATVSEAEPDFDGYWLRRVRDAVGCDCPVIGTIDPHANLSAKMVEACDGLVAYRTNPHVDQRERGMEAAGLMAATLRGEICPKQFAARLPAAINIECQATDQPPCLPIYQLSAQLRQRAGVLSTSICLGFPYADVQEMGAATLCVANGEAGLARQVACELADTMWSCRANFVPELVSVDVALERVEAQQRGGSKAAPICLLDMGDNVGGGSPGDATFLAAALERRRIRDSFVCLCDGQAVNQARSVNVGDEVQLAVGGKSDGQHGRPLEAMFRVRGVYDGKFCERQPRHGGVSSFDQGLTAVVQTRFGLTVMLTSQRMAPWSLAQLESCQLDPKSFQVLTAKGVHSPIAAYRSVCEEFIRVNTPGCTSADLSTFEYQRRRRPMFPFEPSTTWSSDDV